MVASTGPDHILIIRCHDCDAEHTIMVYDADLYDYMNNGTLVQNAFPYLSKSDREMIITGICPKCWDKLFDVELTDDDSDNGD